MSLIKKIGTLFMAGAMVLGLGATGVQAEGDAPTGDTGTATTTTGSITIKSPVLGATYDAYKVFDMTMNQAGDAFGYTIKEDSPFYNAVVKYANMPAEGEDADKDGLTLSLSNADSDPKVYGVTVTSAFKAKEFGEFLRDCIDSPSETHPAVNATPISKTVAVADTEKVVFNNLDLGYYLILSRYQTYTKTTTLAFGDPDNPEKTWTFTTSSTEEQIQSAAQEYANLTYPDEAAVQTYVAEHADDFDKTWDAMTDEEKADVKKQLIDSLTEDTVNKIHAALNKIAGDESDDNTIDNRLVILDSTTPDVVVYEKNETDKWDVPVNPEGSATLPGLPDHGEPNGGKNIIVGTTSDGKPIYADWTEANIGDDIHYQLRINAMNYVRTNPSTATDTTSSIEQVKEYIIADYQSKALTFDANQGIKVHIEDANGNTVGLKDADGTYVGEVDYAAWAEYFFLNDEGDDSIASPKDGILGNGGGIVIPWVGVTKDLDSLNGNPNYTVSEQPKVDENGNPVFVKGELKTDENGQPVQVDGHYVTTKGEACNQDGYLVDENNVPIQDKELYYIYSLYNSDVTIVVDYHMILNDKAAIDGDGNINYSQYGLNYVDEDDYNYTPNKPNEKPDNPPGKPDNGREVDEATVYTYALAFKKVNDQGEALANATFELPFYVKKTADETDGAYIYAFATLPAVFNEGDSADNYTNSLTTPASGEITIKGMKQGTYTFKETAAPAGYNKLPDSFDVEAQKTGKTETTKITKYLDENGNVIEDETTTEITVTYENTKVAVYEFAAVINKQGSELPSTGGTGTKLFYAIGGILVAVAGVLLVSRKRMLN